MNAVHPGAVHTEIQRRAKFLVLMYIFIYPIIAIFIKTAADGAQTSIYLAVSEEVEGVSGLYFR